MVGVWHHLEVKVEMGMIRGRESGQTSLVWATVPSTMDPELWLGHSIHPTSGVTWPSASQQVPGFLPSRHQKCRHPPPPSTTVWRPRGTAQGARTDNPRTLFIPAAQTWQNTADALKRGATAQPQAYPLMISRTEKTKEPSLIYDHFIVIREPQVL